MQTKFIFVSGGVLSGLGKGVSAASIGLLLQSRGFSITLIKFENYLNIDAGLINPIEHGDPFLCNDGTEADMDMGSYEKFLDKDVGGHNFVTMGQVYREVIRKERNFEYRGEDVEAIPHVIDEIIRRIRLAASVEKADIVIVELGGTAGEYQNILYYEASRIMQRVHKEAVVHVHVSYLPTPRHLGEPKTKPTQLSVKFLNSMGIQPDFIVGRGEKPIDKRRRERLAMFCSVEPDAVINNPDEQTPYAVPLTFEKQQFAQKILKKLQVPNRAAHLTNWKKLVSRIEHAQSSKKQLDIAIVGKYFATGEYELRDSYAALMDALDHAAWFKDYGVRTHWINAERIERGEPIEKLARGADGIIVPIGWGPRGVEGMIRGIQHAREQKVPYLGLCYGMQLIVVEFARNVLGWKDAHSTENDPDTPHPVIHLIPQQQEIMQRRAYGGTMRLGRWDCRVEKDMIAYAAYETYDGFLDKRSRVVAERHRHRYEFNDKYTQALTDKGLRIAGRSVVEDLVEIVELPKSKHPFFLGTQFHPEYKSRPGTPHPIFISFIHAAIAHSKG